MCEFSSECLCCVSMVFVMLMLPFDDCVFELIRSLRSLANAGYSKINSLRAGSLFLGPLAAPPPKFFLKLAQVSYCEQQQKRFPLRTQTYYWSSLLSIRKVTGGETRRPEIGLRSQATSRLYLSLSWLCWMILESENVYTLPTIIYTWMQHPSH